MVTGSHIFLAALPLSADSLLAGIAASALIRGRGAAAAYAALFGLADAAATLVGAALPHRLPDLPDAVLYALAVLVFGGAAARGSRAMLHALPFLLGLDNLAAGLPAAAAVPLGAASAAMAAAGLLAGALARRTARRVFA